MDLTLASKGVDLVGIENGNVSLTSNLSDDNRGTLLDGNRITLKDLAANGNSFDGVNVLIESANQEINHAFVNTFADQSNEIFHEIGLVDLNSNNYFNSTPLVRSSNNIDILSVMANFNGGNGIVALASSNDTVENIAVEFVEASVINTIDHETLTEILSAPTPTNGFPTANTLNTINLDDVIANQNTLNGTLLQADAINIQNSTFMDNVGYGLDLTGDSSLTNVSACHNVLGPETHTADLTTINFDTLDCPEEAGAAEAVAGGGAGPEAAGMPWQIINVYMDPGKNGGTLSCQFGTTYLYLEKMGTPATDFEWARVELAPCIVPGGTTGTFTGLGQGALPGALPDGVTFQGKAFDFELTGAGGSAVSLGGTMNVRFTLPAGFSLPSGKKLAILWFDPAAKQWVELTTYAGGVYANAYASRTGAFVLVIK
jgi:hypothetical protein